MQPCFPGRPTLQDVHKLQADRVELQLNPKADEVSLDHRVEIVELVRRQVARVIIESIACTEREFENHRSRVDVERLASLVADLNHEDSCLGLVRDVKLAPAILVLVPQSQDTVCRCILSVRLKKRRVTQRDFEIVEPSPQEWIEADRFDVMSRDPLDQLIVKSQPWSRGNRSSTLRKLWSW